MEATGKYWTRIWNVLRSPRTTRKWNISKFFLVAQKGETLFFSAEWIFLHFTGTHFEAKDLVLWRVHSIKFKSPLMHLFFPFSLSRKEKEEGTFFAKLSGVSGSNISRLLGLFSWNCQLLSTVQEMSCQYDRKWVEETCWKLMFALKANWSRTSLVNNLPENVTHFWLALVSFRQSFSLNSFLPRSALAF